MRRPSIAVEMSENKLNESLDSSLNFNVQEIGEISQFTSSDDSICHLVSTHLFGSFQMEAKKMNKSRKRRNSHVVVDYFSLCCGCVRCDDIFSRKIFQLNENHMR